MQWRYVSIKKAGSDSSFMTTVKVTRNFLTAAEVTSEHAKYRNIFTEYSAVGKCVYSLVLCMYFI